MSITYGPAYIEVRNGRVAVARNWTNEVSSGVERATNWEELEDTAIRTLRKLVGTNSLDGAYTAPPRLARMARFGSQEQDAATDWIPLAEARTLTGVSLSGLDHAIERGHLDVKLDLSGPRTKRLVRRGQVLLRWPPNKLAGSGNRLRWVGKNMNLTERQIIVARFWQKVEQGDQKKCWLWRGGKTGRGYGIFWLGGKPRPAHKVAFELSNRTEVPADQYVRHTCHNPLCCNPHHLYQSTTNR